MTPVGAPERPELAGACDGMAGRLRQRRQLLGMTVERLAVRAGVSARTVNRLEHGGNARVSTLTALAGVLIVPVSWLAGGNWDDR